MMQKERLVRLICFNDITKFSSGDQITRATNRFLDVLERDRQISEARNGYWHSWTDGRASQRSAPHDWRAAAARERTNQKGEKVSASAAKRKKIYSIIKIIETYTYSFIHKIIIFLRPNKQEWVSTSEVIPIATMLHLPTATAPLMIVSLSHLTVFCVVVSRKENTGREEKVPLWQM